MAFWLKPANTPPPCGVEIDVQLVDGSVLCEALRQADGSYWWRERFFDAAEVAFWRRRPDASDAQVRRLTT